MPGAKYLLEDGSGHYQLEDGTGDYLLEQQVSDPPKPRNRRHDIRHLIRR